MAAKIVYADDELRVELYYPLQNGSTLDLMLPRTQRLHTASDFKRLRIKGRKWQSASFIALVLPNRPEVSTSRLGIIVSAKAGKAVVRKRLSRVLRAAFAEAMISFPQAKLDIVLIARPYLLRKTSQEVAEELRRMLQAGERKWNT